MGDADVVIEQQLAHTTRAAQGAQEGRAEQFDEAIGDDICRTGLHKAINVVGRRQ